MGCLRRDREMLVDFQFESQKQRLNIQKVPKQISSQNLDSSLLCPNLGPIDFSGSFGINFNVISIWPLMNSLYSLDIFPVISARKASTATSGSVQQTWRSCRERHAFFWTFTINFFWNTSKVGLKYRAEWEDTVKCTINPKRIAPESKHPLASPVVFKLLKCLC